MEGQPCSEEVITWASSINTNQDLSKEVYCTHQQQRQPSEIEVNNGMTAAKVAQPQSNRNQKCTLVNHSRSVIVNHGVPLCEGQRNECSGMSDIRVSPSGHTFDRSRGSQLELRAGPGDQESSPARDLNASRMGSDEASRREMEGINVCRGLHQGHQVCSVHDHAYQTGITMGSELSKLCSSSSGGPERVPGDEAQDGSRDGTEDSKHDPVSTVEVLSSQHSGLGGDLASGSVIKSKDNRDYGISEENHGRGRKPQDDSRAQCGGSRRQDDQDGGDAAGARAPQGGASGTDSVREEIQHRKSTVMGAASMNHLCQQIESAQLTIEKDLAKLQSLWKTPARQRHASQQWHLDVLEVYCEPDSQITEQCQRLGLRAERFTIHDRDLSTSAGREALWKTILEKKPKEIWMSPECKYWGNYSRRNMGRSISTANKILDGREKQRVHLKLCNEVFLHQMEVCGHFHLEQPQGSEAIDQPEMKDIKEGTLCTVFDMCEVGKLLAPKIQRKTSGNNFLRKRTTVFTSSRLFHKAFDHRLCVGNHSHVPIAGKVFHLGRWISLSEYAARYSSGFGRNVARYVACGFCNLPVLWEELSVGDVDESFIGAVMSRKRENISQDVQDEQEPDSKRLRYASKRPPRGEHGCAVNSFWDGIFSQMDPKVPRVGKRVFTHGGEIDEVQRGVSGVKVRRIEVCRGTERFRVPDTSVNKREIPIRITVIKDRTTGKAEVLGPPEEWTHLPKSKQVRKGKPAKMSITIFGEKVVSGVVPSKREEGSGEFGNEPSAGVPPFNSSQNLELELIPQEEHPEVGDGDGDGDVMKGISGCEVPSSIARHGPGFLQLTGEEKSQIRRLHHNLGHPTAERLVKFLKERHVEPRIVRGAWDYQCDSCAESKVGFESARPAAIHDDLGFNEVVGVDTAVWSNHLGQQFSFTHVVDEGTLFHLGIPVENTDAETQIRAFQRAWLLWAGPPQTIYVDPASEFRSELWQDHMQSLDINIKMAAGDAHWQLGRVEAHGSIVKKMLDRMDLECPIKTPLEFEEALTQAFTAKNSLSRVKGYSPEQAVLGISRKLPGSLTSQADVGSMTMAEGEGLASDRFRASLELRTSARKAFIDADNSSSLRRALLRRSRPLRGPFEVGDWVLYWRRKGANLRRERGRWFGPASVVAVEGLRNVWLNHSGRLVRASPEQIRPASFREWKKLPESPRSSADAKPISSFSQNLRGGVFIDLEGDDIPPDDDVEPESPGYSPSSMEPEGERSAESHGETESQPGDEEETQLEPFEVPIPDTPFESDGELPNGDDVCDSVLFGDDVVFDGSGNFDLWEMEIPWEPKQELSSLCAASADESVLLVSDARKQKVEVKLSNLKSADQLRMAVAKHKEIGAWLKHSTVRKVAKGKIPESAVMRCRWILSWKSAGPNDSPADVNNGQKAKARLVVVGFEDPGVGIVKNDSPTLSKDGRQMILQQVSSNGWDLISFDVSTAFLHGDGDGRLLGIHPPPELREALGMSETDQCSLEGGAYGRVDAPYLWYCKFRDTLVAEGFYQCPLDPCVFTLATKDSKGQLRIHGSVGIHVDDGIGGGDQVFLASLQRIKSKFNFGSFEKGSFTFTGIRFQQWDDKSIEYDQVDYIDKISPLEVPKHRRNQPQSSITAAETTQLRSLVGALQYAAVHTRPDLSAKVGEIQSCVPKATVSDLISANKVLHEAKVNKVSLMTVPIAPSQVTFCAFSDASFLSGKEKFAHQGGLIFATTPELLENKKTVVAPVAWISKKIHRVTRSTLGAEAIALSGTVDRLLWIRLIWEWLQNPGINWGNPEEVLAKARQAALVTDCKSAYDLLTRTAIPQCEEHRTTIECLLIRERLRANCAVRWVTSNAQLADCLTKSMDSSSLRDCLRSGRYCLFDENRVLQERSDKRQRAKWMKEATTSIETSSTEDIHFNFGVEDTWEKNDKGQVVRIHNMPRRTRFSPIGVPGCPVDIRNLGVERATFAKFSSGETWCEKDFWPGTRGYTALDRPWTGKTIFEVQGM